MDHCFTATLWQMIRFSAVRVVIEQTQIHLSFEAIIQAPM
jgi:hypothetical protein